MRTGNAAIGGLRFGALALLLAALLSGCANTQHYFTRFAEIGNLNDPRAIVDDSIDGARVTLRQGESLVVHLPMDAASGGLWVLQPLASDTGVRILQPDYMPSSGPATLPRVPPYSLWLEKHNPPGYPDRVALNEASSAVPFVQNGEAVLRLRGVAPGTAHVQVDYRRLEEAGAPPAKSVRFDVDVLAVRR